LSFRILYLPHRYATVLVFDDFHGHPVRAETYLSKKASPYEVWECIESGVKGLLERDLSLTKGGTVDGR